MGLFLFVLLLALLLAVGVLLLRRQVNRQTGKIQQVNAQFTAFMRHLPGITYMKDVQGRYLFVNAAWERKNGLSEAAVLGKTSAQVWPDRVVKEQREEQQVIASSELVETTEFHPWGDPPGYWGMTRFPILDAAGQVVMVGCFGLNVTAQKEIATELSHLHRQLQLILESAGDGILGLNGRGHCTFVNKAALEILGYRREELIGSHFHGLVQHSLPDGSDYPEQRSGIYQACHRGQGTRVERAVFWHAEGASVEVEYSVHPIAEGKVPGAVLVFRLLQPDAKTEHPAYGV
jgi:PAS domain S-box-containing protein